MTTKLPSMSESNDDVSDSSRNNRLSIPAVPITVPSLPPTSSSRGQVDQNKEKLRSATSPNGSDDVTRALEANELPPKLYLSASNPNNERGQPTMPNNSPDAPGRTIASTILGRQTKLEHDHDRTTNEAPNNTNSTRIKESIRPANTGAFAIAGPQQDATISENVDSEDSHQGNEASDNANGADQTDPSNMIHAEIAPNVEEILQERLQAIQQEREDAMVVAVATNDNHTSDNNDKDSPGLQWTSRTKLLVITSMICFTVLVAGITGGIVAWLTALEEPSPATTSNPTNTAIDSPSPSSTPTTAMPTTVRQEMILPSLVDLAEGTTRELNHPEAVEWLLESDVWVPLPNATDPHDLWRERYFMVAFFLATRGEDVWLDRQSWLSPTTGICDWDCCGGNNEVEIVCHQDGRLEGLTVRQNRILGTIPFEIKALNKLEEIDLSGNNLRGTLPSELGLLTRLTRMDMHGNQLTGSLPSGLGNLVNLQDLELQQTALTGQLPSEVGSWSMLRSISLFENNLRGTLPKEISQWTNLEYLRMDGNQFSGPLPPEIGNWTQIQWLYLSSNSLTGTLPGVALGALTNLLDLSLDDNLFGGSVPSELGLLTRLEILLLGSNELSGELPTELLHLSTYIFDVSYNQLTGVIPSLDLSNTSRIFCLDGNRFSTDLGNQNGRDCRA